MRELRSYQCPVYAVGGWTDGYKNAIPRLLEGRKVPRKGLIGPWAHGYPHFALPGPQIGFLQEILRWWDYWLKGVDTGVMNELMLRAWMTESVKPATRRHSAGPVDRRAFLATASNNAPALVLDRCGAARNRGTFDGSRRMLAADGWHLFRRVGSIRSWARSGA